MKRLLHLIIYIAATCPLLAQENGTPLLSALHTIEQRQSDYAIDIVSDGLESLCSTLSPSRLHSMLSTDGLDAAKAVKRVCKGLPVKVKVRGRRIYVQAKRKPRVETVNLVGQIEDGFLKIPLIEAKVSIFTADSAVVKDSVGKMRFLDSKGRLVMAYFSHPVSPGREYLVRATLKGYDDVWKRVAVSATADDDVEVPKLQMHKMRNIQLNEVVVTATRVKFFWRGDTLIYDATAFNLPEGSMLDDLIRQMPGVTLNQQGEIFVNGRKVDELLLGSRSFLGGNKRVLMENLPYYTVKDIKVYEKQTDKSEALGYDVDPRRYVMDVNLKNEYSRGWIANIEGAIGTEDRWLGRAFALGYTDRTRFTLLGNANNVNESRHIGESDHWTPASMPRSMVTTRSAAAEIDYQSKGSKVKETLRADYTSTTDEQEMRQRHEQFLAGLTPTALTNSFSHQGSKTFRMHNNLSLKKPFWLSTEIDFSYAKRDGSFNSAFDQWGDTLTASLRSVGMSKGTAWSGYVEAQGAFNIGKQKRHMDFYLKVQHDDDQSEASNRYSTNAAIQHNANDISNRMTWMAASTSFGIKLQKDVSLGFSEMVYIFNQRRHDYLYHPDTLLLASQLDALTAITDPQNSYDSHHHGVESRTSISLSKSATYNHSDFHVKVGYQPWRISLSLPVHHETLSYQRGSIDTLASQNAVFLNATGSFRQVWKGSKRDLRINASHDRQVASLQDRIDYRDDSRPLVVKLGNPHLKGTVVSKLSAEYMDFYPHRAFYLDASFSYHHRDVAQSATYDATTGAYTYRPMNVSGAYTAAATISYSSSIDKKHRWSWRNRLTPRLHHSVDHAMLAGDTESSENTVNTLTLDDNAYIQFEKGALKVSIDGDISWRHSEGRMRDFESLNALNYSYGLSARYTLPLLNTTITADGTMYSRRGYGSNNLNTDDFLLNASLSQPFFKGKLIARLEAFDLLQQLSATQYEVNAQGRTETWHRSLPRYVMLHLVYHWSKQPKKK